jgi:hypothetical protein
MTFIVVVAGAVTIENVLAIAFYTLSLSSLCARLAAVDLSNHARFS